MIDLREFVRPGDTVAWGQAGGEPRALIGALLEQAAGLGGITAFVGLTVDERLASTPGLALRSYGALGVLAGAQVDVLRCHMSALPGLIRSGRQPVDVAFCQVSPAGPDGYHGLGVSVDYLLAAVGAARVVLAEVDPRVPLTRGPGRVHGSVFAATVAADRGPASVPDRQGGEIETRIAAHVAELVPDGATLQLGVGGLATAVATALRGHRGLRVHSGLVGDWLVDLAESGALVTGEGRPAAVAGTALGTDRLYRHLDRNPRIEMRPVELVHPPAVTAAIPGFVAVNQALQVDLDGQVGAESVAGRYLGSVGGQVDFLRGAAMSAGGVGIVALPSVTTRGASRIVERLDGPVTTSAADVGWVVTEHGAVDLRGLTRGERARALRTVADPSHRPASETWRIPLSPRRLQRHNPYDERRPRLAAAPPSLPLREEDGVRRMYDLGLWDERTFADIIDEHARKQPDKTAVIDARGRLSYAELSDLSVRLAAVLHELGVGAGSPVAAQLPGCTLLPALHLACVRIGALFMPLSTAWRGAELRPLLAAVDAAVLVVPGEGGIAGDDFDFPGLAASIRARRPGLRAVLPARSGGGDAIEARARAAAPLTAEQLAALRVPAEAPTLVMSSSGTTGTPKAAVWGGNDLKALLLHNVVPRLRITADDVAAGLAPAGTGSTGYIFPVLTPLLLGATAAILERWSPQGALDLIAVEGATYATAIPTQMVMLLPLALESADLSRFTRFNNAGAPLPPSTARELEERMGCRVQSIYGSTDGGVPVMTSVDDDDEVRRTTVGSVCIGVDVRLVGADGAALAPGEAGEVCWRDSKSYGYLNQPAYDAAAFDAERWFHSGDVGRFDGRGNLRIVGRIKDMILRGGTNIFPAEIEHLVAQHPGVADVAVVGVPDDRLGERACAVVVPVAGVAPDLAGICAFLREREVAVVKLPEELVLVDALPTNAGGKIDRAGVRDAALTALRSRPDRPTARPATEGTA